MIATRLSRSGLPAGRAGRAWAGWVAAAALALSLLPAPPVHGERTTTVDIAIKNGHVVGRKSVRVTRGETVILRWNSDQQHRLHLHGYDVETIVAPGAPAEMKIHARATGRFPVAIHRPGGAKGGHGHANIFHLEVYPD